MRRPNLILLKFSGTYPLYHAKARSFRRRPIRLRFGRREMVDPRDLSSTNALGRGQCLSGRPSTSNPIHQCSNWKHHVSGPLGNTLGSIVVGEEMIASPVLGLLTARGPSAIIRRVRSVVVNAIQGVTPRRSRPHISQKGCEVNAPSFAHDNAAPAVIRERSVSVTKAAPLRSSPRRVFGRTALAVRGVVRCCLLSIQTAATARWFQCARQHSRLHDLDLAAIATASPHAPAVGIGPNKFHSNQSSESSAAKVWHLSLVNVAHVY